MCCLAFFAAPLRPLQLKIPDFELEIHFNLHSILPLPAKRDVHYALH